VLDLPGLNFQVEGFDMTEYILGIETSCDDTSIAVVDSSRNVVAMKTVSQNSIHQVFGGVIPEIAARNHIAWIIPTLDSVIKDSDIKKEDISAIAVTSFPGLVGSLLVGVGVAKGLSVGLRKPIIAVNHLEAHVHSAFLGREELPEDPYLALIISGGHTSIVEVENGGWTRIGETIDDAAGEAYDKVSKMAGLGYPGGPIIDKVAEGGDPQRYKLPYLLRSNNKYKDKVVFSFSGIKSAVKRFLDSDEEIDMKDLMAGFQHRVMELVERKLKLAFTRKKYKALVVAGGVSANSELRRVVTKLAGEESISLFLPELKYCQDNGAMTAAAAIPRFEKGEFSPLDFDVSPTTRSPR
jgi:N6-L-threonylcarbamoyladenine synthase